jgi:hypothetical protein
MKLITLTFALCASFAFAADETADRAAIEKSVTTLTGFTADFDSRDVLLKLAAPADGATQPGVVVSTKPWGEATIVMPGVPVLAGPKVNKIRLITPEVAIVDAMGKAPMLFVLRKENGDWKIASVRATAP